MLPPSSGGAELDVPLPLMGWTTGTGIATGRARLLETVAVKGIDAGVPWPRGSGGDDRERVARESAAAVVCRAAGEGRVAASRASLNLLLALPVEAKRRCCLTPPPTLVLKSGPLDPAWLAFRPKTPLTQAVPDKAVASMTGMGAALAAAMDRESRLNTEPSFCTAGSVGEVMVELSVSDMVGRVGDELHTTKEQQDGEIDTER